MRYFSTTAAELFPCETGYCAAIHVLLSDPWPRAGPYNGFLIHSSSLSCSCFLNVHPSVNTRLFPSTFLRFGNQLVHCFSGCIVDKLLKSQRNRQIATQGDEHPTRSPRNLLLINATVDACVALLSNPQGDFLLSAFILTFAR